MLRQPKVNKDDFYLEIICDSEYAGDPDTLISVYGYVIVWKSKAGKSATLSSTEEVYY
jgi:hypothetical protein